jgi:hypothetical protein
MIYASLKYSLKVWLTSVLLSPVLYLLIQSFVRGGDYLGGLYRENELFELYVALIMFGAIFSILTLLFFWLLILLIVRNTRPGNLRKWTIFLSGLFLTGGNFWVMNGTQYLFHDPDGLVYLMLANFAVIGCCVFLFYRLEGKTEE